MILEISLGLTVLNLLVNLVINLVSYRKIRNLVMTLRQVNAEATAQSMSQVETDLNNRLRMLQTQQFSPQMGRPGYRRPTYVESDE